MIKDQRGRLLQTTKLSAKQHKYLSSIAQTDYPSRSMARALLSVYAGVDFGIDELPEDTGSGKNSNSGSKFDVSQWEALDIQSIQIAPNPVVDQFQLYLPQALAEGSSIGLYDLKGQLVDSRTLREGEQWLTWDISRLARGIYLLQAGNNGSIKLLKE